MSDLEGIFPARVSAHLLERLPDELSQVENGTLFIAWPKPPRVGRRVRVELAFGDEPPRSIDALVVWARPPRPGVVGGFRAQLIEPPPDLLSKLRDLVEVVRQRLMLRDLEGAPARRPSPAPEPFVITERVRVRAAPEPTTRPLQLRTPVEPQPSPDSLELELDASHEGGWRGSMPAFEPPAGQPSLELELELPVPPSPEATPATPPPATPVPETVDDLFADLAEELKSSPPSAPATPTPTKTPPVRVQTPPANDSPVRVPYATGASYLLHYERFLQHGEVYVTTAAAPPIGARCALLLLVPDGEAPVEVDAIAVREVQPPDVPVRGWVAALVDPEGHVAERLATASFVLAG